MLLQNTWAMSAGGVRFPVFVGSAESSLSGASTTVSVNKPAGVADGDILLALMVVGDEVSPTWTGDTGFSETGLFDQGAKPGLRAAIKTAASEGSSYTFTSSRNDELCAQVLAFRFAALEASGSVVTRSGNGDLVLSGITAALGWLVGAVGSGKQAARTHSTPSGMALELDTRNGSTFLTSYLEQVAAGSTGTRTSTIGGGAGTAAGALINIKSA